MPFSVVLLDAPPLAHTYSWETIISIPRQLSAGGHGGSVSGTLAPARFPKAVSGVVCRVTPLRNGDEIVSLRPQLLLTTLSRGQRPPKD